MTPSQLQDPNCFHCILPLRSAAANPVSICTSDGHVICVRNTKTGNIEPMIFCSSNCMLFDCQQRYLYRQARGSLSSPDESYGKRIPQRWNKMEPVLVKTPSNLLESVL